MRTPTWAAKDKRSRGRPRETWRRTVLKERAQLGFSTWNEAETAANDRAIWKKKTMALFSTRRERIDDRMLLALANVCTHILVSLV